MAIKFRVDKRKKYIAVVDTETANGFMENGKINLFYSLVYDYGYIIRDLAGNILVARSFAIKEIFLDKNLMSSAYYAEKIPQYWEEIKSGKRQLVSFFTMRKIFLADCKKYNVKTVTAHNAGFDVRALNNTIRLLTGSRCRYFFPYKFEIWDTLKMSRDVFKTLKGYNAYCVRNSYMTKHKVPQIKCTAEILYKYISGNDNFIEEHKGIDDVLIESEILTYCLKSHKKMRKRLYN